MTFQPSGGRILQKVLIDYSLLVTLYHILSVSLQYIETESLVTVMPESLLIVLPRMAVCGRYIYMCVPGSEPGESTDSDFLSFFYNKNRLLGNSYQGRDAGVLFRLNYSLNNAAIGCDASS